MSIISRIPRPVLGAGAALAVIAPGGLAIAGSGSSDTITGTDGSPPPNARPVTMPNGQPAVLSENTPADHTPGKAAKGRARKKGGGGNRPAKSRPVTMANGQPGVLSENTPEDHIPGQAGEGDTLTRSPDEPVGAKAREGGKARKGRKIKGNGESKPPNSRQVTMPNGQPGVLSEDTPEDHTPGQPGEGDTLTSTPDELVGPGPDGEDPGDDDAS